MIVSSGVYAIIFAAIAAAALLPFIVGKLTKRQEPGFWQYSFVLLVVLLPFNWYTPTIIDVDGTGQIDRRVVLFPSKDYKLGRYNYINNMGPDSLVFEYVMYGSVDEGETPDKALILPGELYRADVVAIDYLFVDAPQSIRIKGNGAIKTRLYRYDGTLHDDESPLSDEEGPLPCEESGESGE
ncbi:MAG: hypothetical protein LBH06_05285 [Rikenellaceae bacterium]|jgi:hypothetical protein|nr:hypothetical protein [Rikenellaceae bacterium]